MCAYGYMETLLTLVPFLGTFKCELRQQYLYNVCAFADPCAFC